MLEKDIVERFCLPSQTAETEFDQKAFADAEKKEIIFEGIRLYLYSWGSGKNILLVHAQAILAFSAASLLETDLK